MRSSSDWVKDGRSKWERTAVQKTRGLNLNHNHLLKDVFKGALVARRLPTDARQRHQAQPREVDARAKGRVDRARDVEAQGGLRHGEAQQADVIACLSEWQATARQAYHGCASHRARSVYCCWTRCTVAVAACAHTRRDKGWTGWFSAESRGCPTVSRRVEPSQFPGNSGIAKAGWGGPSRGSPHGDCSSSWHRRKHPVAKSWEPTRACRPPRRTLDGTVWVAAP